MSMEEKTPTKEAGGGEAPVITPAAGAKNNGHASTDANDANSNLSTANNEDGSSAADDANSSPANITGGFHRLQIKTVMNDDQPCEGLMAPVDLRTCSLFVHHDDKTGLLRQAPTNARIQEYHYGEYKDQLVQFVEKPHEALPPLASTFVLHSQKTLYTTDKEQRAALLLPRDDHMPSEDLFVHHATLEEANELLAEMSDADINTMVPQGVDMKDATHVATLAMHRMAEQPDSHVYARLMVWEAKKAKSSKPEDYKQIFDEAKRDAEGMQEIKLYKETRRLLQSLTDIRVSTVEGRKRVDIVVYCFSGLFASIGLSKGVGKIEQRGQVRNSVRTHSYLIQFINLGQHADDGNIFTRKELVLCRSIAFHRQTGLEKGKPVGLGDRAVCFSEEMALCSDNIAPWQQDKVKGNDWITTYHTNFIDNVVPEFLPKKSLVEPKGQQGVFGMLKKQVFYLLVCTVMKMKANARKTFMDDNIPYWFRVPIVKHLNRFGKWQEDELDYCPEPQPVMVACSYITAHTAMLLSHSLKDNRLVLQPLISHWQQHCSIYGRNGQLNVVKSMVKFGEMLVVKFVLPMFAVLVTMKQQCGYDSKCIYRCQWIWYCQQAQLYRELSLMYNQQASKTGMLHSEFNITAFCSKLAQTMADKTVFGRAKIGRRDDGNPGSPTQQIRDQRYYPEANLTDFSAEFSLNDPKALGKDAFGNQINLTFEPKPLPQVILCCGAYIRDQPKEGDPPEKQGDITWPFVLGCVLPVKTVVQSDAQGDDAPKPSATDGNKKESLSKDADLPEKRKRRKAPGEGDGDSTENKDYDPAKPNDFGPGSGKPNPPKKPRRKNKTPHDFDLTDADRQKVKVVLDSVTTPETSSELIPALSWCFCRTQEVAIKDALTKMADGPVEEQKEEPEEMGQDDWIVDPPDDVLDNKEHVDQDDKSESGSEAEDDEVESDNNEEGEEDKMESKGGGVKVAAAEEGKDNEDGKE